MTVDNSRLISSLEIEGPCALDILRSGKPVPPELHQATIAKGKELPGSRNMPDDFDEGTGILHFGMKQRMDRWNRGIE